MENRIESIVTGANEVVNKIYEKIGQIDSCKAVLKNLETAQVSLLLPSGEIASLDPALSIEQIAELAYSIRRFAMANIESTAQFLERLSGEPAAAEPAEPAEPAPVPKPEPKPEPEPMKKLEPEKPAVPKEVVRKVPVSKMTVAAVEQLFRDGYTVEDIAKHYGYKTTQTVYNFINKNGIKVKVLTQGNASAKELTEANIPEIRAMYTDGPMSLTDTAADLGTTKKKLHDFCTKHHLHKIRM